MSNAQVDGNGAVVVPATGVDLAVPGNNAQATNGGMARPSDTSPSATGGGTSAVIHASPSTAVTPAPRPSEEETAPNQARPSADTNPNQAGEDTRPEAQQTGAPAEPTEERPAEPNEPAENTAADPVSTESHATAPSETAEGNRPAEPTPDPSPGPGPTSPDTPDSQASGLNEVNVFAPEVADDQPDPAASDVPPAAGAAVVAETSSSASEFQSTGSVTQPSSSSSTTTPSTMLPTAASTSPASSRITTSTPAEAGSSASSIASVNGDNDMDQTTVEGGTAAEAPSPSGNAIAGENGVTQVAEVTAAPDTNAVEGESTVEPETTFVSGSTTFTGTAALAAAAAAETGGEERKAQKDGLSSFAIIGIVGGVLVFFILLYVAWFQWRKRRARKDLERIDDIDGLSPTSTAYDPYGLANEKHSGFDFIDQPLSSRRSQKSRVQSQITANPFADTTEQLADGDYERRLETQYTESFYTDPGDAGLGTARTRSWFTKDGWERDLDVEVQEDDDRRPSYIDGPQSIYHESHDPDNPNAHTWTALSPSQQSPQSARSTKSTAKVAPPVPPLPAAYKKHDSRPTSERSEYYTPPDDRPQTNFSYGDFYKGYDHSRPATQYGQDQLQPSANLGAPMETPATSVLLPWLNQKDAPPPIPVTVPVDPKTLPVHQASSRKNTGAHGFGSPPKMPLRTPPAAAMAQKPHVQSKGWIGVIPSFR